MHSIQTWQRFSFCFFRYQDPKKVEFAYSVYGAACSEAEIDVLTGETDILRSDIIYDCGERCVRKLHGIAKINCSLLAGKVGLTWKYPHPSPTLIVCSFLSLFLHFPFAQDFREIESSFFGPLSGNSDFGDFKLSQLQSWKIRRLCREIFSKSASPLGDLGYFSCFCCKLFDTHSTHRCQLCIQRLDRFECVSYSYRIRFTVAKVKITRIISTHLKFNLLLEFF